MASRSNVELENDSDADEPDDFFDNIGNSSDTSSDDELSENDDNDDVIINPIWKDATNGLKHIDFTGNNELKYNFAPDAKPIDFFLVLFNPIFIENIVNETNRYAEICSKSKNKGRLSQLNEVTIEEFKIFIGLLLHTGTIRLNRIQDYWKTHRLFNIQCFREYMSRDRFLYILRVLHFNKDAETGNPLHKVQPIIDEFNNTMLLIYGPDRELSLDEAMVLWRGRLLIRQYIKGKRHKYGIKFYTLAEPNGLTLKITIYAGKNHYLGGKDHTSKVVMHLMEGKLNMGHSLYMDNYYNSFELASKLLRNNTYCTGTLRNNRKFNPDKVMGAKLKKGETIAQYADGVMIGKWRDKRVVTYISTESKNEMVTFIQKKKKTNNEKQKPLPIVRYNAHMSGVDRGDQLLAYYPCERKTLRWYKKVFVHVLQMLLINSHILYNNYGPKKLSLYDFRLQVLEELLPEQNPPPPSRKRKTDDIAHSLKLTEDRDARNRLNRKRCRMCHKLGKRATTTYYCSGCPDKPGLHPGECFTQYHKKLN